MRLIPVPLGAVTSALATAAHVGEATRLPGAGVCVVGDELEYEFAIAGDAVTLRRCRPRPIAFTHGRALGGAWDADVTMLDPRSFVSLDFETTGRDPLRDRVVQIGLVEFVDLPRGAVRARQSWLVDPGRSIDPAATAVHGIRDADVFGAPKIGALLPDLLARLRGRYVVTFNGLDYDLPLLQAECDRCGVVFDPRSCAPIDVYPFVPAQQGWKGKRLLAQAARYGIAIDAHDASSDAEAAGWLLLCLAMRDHAPATLPECYLAQADLWRDLLRPRQPTLFAAEDDT